MTHIQSKTIVSKVENIKETYVERKFWIFTWRELVRSDSLGKDLVISTLEDYDRIIVNGKVLPLTTINE